MLQLSCLLRVRNSYSWFFFLQAEDGIRDLVRSRGLGDVYKRQFMMSFWGLFGGVNVPMAMGVYAALNVFLVLCVVGLSLIHI